MILFACKLFASFFFIGGTLICTEKLANVRRELKQGVQIYEKKCYQDYWGTH